MRLLAALGVAGGFLFVPGGWRVLFLAVWVASRISPDLAVFVLREVLRSGGCDEARRFRLDRRV